MNYLTVDEFAKRMKLCPATIRRAIKSGKVFATRPGGNKRARYRIAESELERIHIQAMCEPQKKK